MGSMLNLCRVIFLFQFNIFFFCVLFPATLWAHQNIKSDCGASLVSGEKIDYESAIVHRGVSPELLRVNAVLSDKAFQEKFQARLHQEQTSNPKMIPNGKVASINTRIDLLNKLWKEEGNSQELVIINDEPVLISQNGTGTDLQTVPLRKMLLPYVSSGAYIPQNGIYQPKAKVAEANPDSILIALPGIGTNKSNALSLVPLLLRFSKASDDSIAEIKEGDSRPRKARTLALGLDSTGTGLASASAGDYNSPEYSVEMLRHNVLIMKLLFPETPVFIGGRSQGGLQSLEFASRYDDAAGVFAVNPSSTDPTLHNYTILKTEESDFIKSAGLGEDTKLHDEAWGAFKVETLRFSYPTRAPRAPVHILLGKKDLSYALAPNESDSETNPISGRYERSFADYSSQHPDHVRVASWEDGGHELWSGIKTPHIFDQVIQYMSQAMHSPEETPK